MAKRRSRADETPSEAASRQGTLLASLVAAGTFRELDVGASLFERGAWQALHWPDGSVTEFEMHRPTEYLRWRYNERCTEEALASGRPVLGEHAGLHDLFVPVPGAAGSQLVVGPFNIGRPTSSELSERWHTLGNARAAMSDPAFARYFDVTLRTLTLDSRSLPKFRRFVESFAQLLGSGGDPAELAREVATLGSSLLVLRATERMWSAARGMMDDRTTERWWTPLLRDPLLRLGMKLRPEHAIAGLIRPGRESEDTLEEALRRDAFQRALSDLGYARGNLVCGLIGRHGVVLFVGGRAGGPRIKAELLALANRAVELARRFGLRLHVGIALADSAETLAGRYRAALSAAERALSERASIRVLQQTSAPSARNLALLRSELGRHALVDPATWVPRFERYADAVVAQCGYRLDATRAHLLAGFERLAEPLLATGQLDRKSFDEFCAGVDDVPDAPNTVSDLVAAFRDIVGELARTALVPTVSRHDRNLERGLRFMRAHLAEPLTLARVAHIAGFAPNYFSRLLRNREGLSFERLLLRSRLEHAKQTLAGTSLSVQRIADLSGFKSRTHFQQAFKRAYAETPMVYRARASVEVIDGSRQRSARPEWVLRLKRRGTVPERR